MKKLKNLINTLKLKKLTLALAESCTGGFASYLITKTPGASAVFKAGVVVYTLEAKNKLFNLPLKNLQKYGGVSEKIAIILAKKVRKKFAADIGGAIVGFAGPGAKRGVKVGTVFLALNFKNTTISQKAVIKGKRDVVRKKASNILIDLLYKNLPRI